MRDVNDFGDNNLISNDNSISNTPIKVPPNVMKIGGN